MRRFELPNFRKQPFRAVTTPCVDALLIGGVKLMQCADVTANHLIAG